MATALPTLVGRTFLLNSLGQVKLTEQLGSGRLSQVYRGEIADKDAVAVKVAGHDLDATMTEHFRGEFDTLEALRSKAKRLAQDGTVGTFASEYFPKPFYYNPEYTTGHGDSYSIVVMELVQAEKLITRAVSSAKHVLGEPFGLKTAIQYAEMLQVLHEAGYTASDRKIDDIYWRNGDAGPLIVLDWNVVGRGSAGRADDFLRLGSFWYEFLIGETPIYADMGSKRVVRPDARAGWQTLSRGTQSILERLLHPAPQKQYQSAAELKKDLQEQLKLWEMGDNELVADAWADTASVALLDMARRRGYEVDTMAKRIAELDQQHKNERLHSFDALVDHLIAIDGNQDADSLSAISEGLESARLEFWDDAPRRAQAARFLLVTKTCEELKQPLGELPQKLKDLQIGDSSQLGEVQTSIASLALEGQERSLALACLAADMEIHSSILQARKSSNDGQFPSAAKAYKDAEGKRRAIIQQLEKKLGQEHLAEHEWQDLAALYPNLATCMEEAYRRHATQEEPLQLARAAIKLAQVGDEAGARRALAIAVRWTEGEEPTRRVLEKLVDFLPRWPAVQEAILQSPENPAAALQQLGAWIDDPRRQELSQLLAEAPLSVAEIQQVANDQWVAVPQAHLQTTLALRLMIAIAQESVDDLTGICQQIRDSRKYLGATETLQEQLHLLQRREEKRYSDFASSRNELAPFSEEPALIDSQVYANIEARRQLHQSILDQITPLIETDSPATSRQPEETDTVHEAASLAKPEAETQQAPGATTGVSSVSGATDAAEVRSTLSGRNGSWQTDRLADVYRALRGARFSEAAEQLSTADNLTTNGQERVRIARLQIVAQACLIALGNGSNPSPQAVEDLIQAAGCLETDSGLNAADTRLDWSKDACPALGDPEVQMLCREIEVRRAFRKVDQLLAKGQFVDAARSFPDASQEKNGLISGQQGNNFWRELVADWSRKGEQKQRLLKPNQALDKLKQASEAALTSADSGDLGGALSKLAGPVQEAAALKEPDAHCTFHPLAFWLNRVLTVWRDVQALTDPSQFKDWLLVLQQARLTCDHARAVTVVADFDDSLEQFNALVGKLDDEIHSRRKSVCDSLLGQLSETLGGDVSLIDVNRLLSSIFACLWDNVDRRSVLDALKNMATKQACLGERELDPKPNDIEQLSRAVPFYQRARLLGLPETLDTDTKTSNAISSPTERLKAVTEKAQQIRKLQVEYDAARASQQYAVAKEKVEEASEAGVTLKEGGSLNEWDYALRSRALLDEITAQRAARETRLKGLSNYSKPADTLENQQYDRTDS